MLIFYDFNSFYWREGLIAGLYNFNWRGTKNPFPHVLKLRNTVMNDRSSIISFSALSCFQEFTNLQNSFVRSSSPQVLYNSQDRIKINLVKCRVMLISEAIDQSSIGLTPPTVDDRLWPYAQFYKENLYTGFCTFQQMRGNRCCMSFHTKIHHSPA